MKQIDTLPSWKRITLQAAGFGAGFGLVAVLAAGLVLWVSSRPKIWSGKALTAVPAEVGVEQKGDELHFKFIYALTNETSREYLLASGSSGALMAKQPGNGSLAKVDDASWDSAIRIPPRQKVQVTFEVVYRLADYGTSVAELYGDEFASYCVNCRPTPAFTDFVDRRLKENDGFVFFDYPEHYSIQLPKPADSWTLSRAPDWFEKNAPKTGR